MAVNTDSRMLSFDEQTYDQREEFLRKQCQQIAHRDLSIYLARHKVTIDDTDK